MKWSDYGSLEFGCQQKIRRLSQLAWISPKSYTTHCKFSLGSAPRSVSRRPLFPGRWPSREEFQSIAWLVTKVLGSKRNYEIHNLIEASGFDGAPPTIAASSEVAMVPPTNCRSPGLNDNREDARKIWGFEANVGGNPIDKGISLMYNADASVRRRFKRPPLHNLSRRGQSE